MPDQTQVILGCSRRSGADLPREARSSRKYLARRKLRVRSGIDEVCSRRLVREADDGTVDDDALCAIRTAAWASQQVRPSIRQVEHDVFVDLAGVQSLLNC